jgi:hypothetical protein
MRILQLDAILVAEPRLRSWEMQTSLPSGASRRSASVATRQFFASVALRCAVQLAGQHRAGVPGEAIHAVALLRDDEGDIERWALGTAVLIPSRRPVARLFRDKVMCLQPRFSSLSSTASESVRARALFSRPDTGAENEGDKNLTLRTKKNVLSATIIAVLYSRAEAFRHPPLKVEYTQALDTH